MDKVNAVAWVSLCIQQVIIVEVHWLQLTHNSFSNQHVVILSKEPDVLKHNAVGFLNNLSLKFWRQYEQ